MSTAPSRSRGGKSDDGERGGKGKGGNGSSGSTSDGGPRGGGTNTEAGAHTTGLSGGGLVTWICGNDAAAALGAGLSTNSSHGLFGGAWWRSCLFR